MQHTTQLLPAASCNVPCEVWCASQGDEAFVARDYPAAITAYSQALRHETRNAVIWANRAAVHLRLGEPTVCESRNCGHLEPVYVMIGSSGDAMPDCCCWADVAAGSAHEALQDARMSRALDPTYGKAWYREGAAYELLQQWWAACVARVPDLLLECSHPPLIGLQLAICRLS
jgi:tetratricopeptide (TPR) repeat protein